ncbi:MAG: hypothetical protein ACXWT0_09890 [Methylobacter sp.]
MENILIITSEYDIPIAETMASDLVSYKVYFFDPTLVDLVHTSSLRNTELIVWDACLDYPTLVRSAHAHAKALERELGQSMAELLPECSIMGWQHLNLYYFFMAYQWYSGLWPDMLDRLREGKAHVFLCDNPFNYYWPSFVPALLLLQQLRTFDIPFSATTYGKRPDESDVVINLCDGSVSGEYYDLLTHLPTCFYDIDYFNEELQASGKTNININPKYWGVELAATQNVNLMRLKDQQLIGGGHPKLDTLAERLSTKLDALLMPYIATPSFRERQVANLSNLYQSQIVSLHVLEHYFSNCRPGKVLMSDHDAGFHGPLMAFAEKNHIPVVVVPHSKTSVDIEFAYRNITVLSHPIQGLPPFNGDRKLLLHFALSYAETFSGKSAMPQQIRKVGLLLNGLSLNGIFCTNFSTYIEGIKQIDHWCKHNDIELLIRCRPGQSLYEILNQAIGIGRSSLQACLTGSLQDFAENIDLCLMYDAPTNAEIQFLRMGVPILNPIPEPLTKAEAVTGNSQVIPHNNVSEILSMLDDFVADNNNFHTFCNRQFANYVSLFKNACALRRFL